MLVVVAQNDVISLLLLSPCVPLFLAAAGIRAVSPPTAFYFVLASFAFGTNTCKVKLRYNVILFYERETRRSPSRLTPLHELK